MVERSLRLSTPYAQSNIRSLLPVSTIVHLFAIVAALIAAVPLSARATSTISPANPYSYGANIGWMNWRASTADGVEIGEYVCSGYIYGANVGWIHMGDGTPDEQHSVREHSATDFGVNYSIDPAQPGYAILRGYAYGANIGWINFESTGNPRLRFSDGNFEGYAYSANCGWINLGNGAFTFEHRFRLAGYRQRQLTEWLTRLSSNSSAICAMNGTTDTDGDGMSDADEYAQGTSPTSRKRSAAHHALHHQSRRHKFTRHLDEHRSAALPDRGQSRPAAEQLERRSRRSESSRRTRALARHATSPPQHPASASTASARFVRCCRRSRQSPTTSIACPASPRPCDLNNSNRL